MSRCAAVADTSAMCGGERLPARGVLVLAVIVLACTCVTSRPQQDNAVGYVTSNEITKKDASTTTLRPSPSPSPYDTDGDSSAEVIEVIAATPGSSSGQEVAKEDLVDARNVSKAVNHQHPHAVLFGGTCGGTIISPTWILTAGHCTLFTGGRFVLAGTGNSMDGSGVTRQVKRLVLHPKFSVGPYWLDANRFGIQQVAANWDFLLAELDLPLPLDGQTMAAVDINDVARVPAGLHVGYAGYGAEHHGEVMRHMMHGMDLEVMPDGACSGALVQYEPQDMLCTRGRPPRFDSACNGDSGSGLVADGKLYGVASWVENDAHRCYNGALVVFSRVSSVRDWIRQVTAV